MRAMFAFLSSENSESLDEDRFCLDVVCHSWALPLRLLGLGIRDCKEPADDSHESAIYRSAGSVLRRYSKKTKVMHLQKLK
jgi:hypothetical protein